MKKLITLAAAALVALLAVRLVTTALASDETRIRRRLDHMAAAFDETRLGPIAEGLARDFTDRHSGMDRAFVLDGLRALFVAHATGPFPYRVLLEDLELTFDEQAAPERAAEVALLARFQDVSGDAPRTVWAVTIEARLVERDGWQVLSTAHVSAEGDWRGLQ